MTEYKASVELYRSPTSVDNDAVEDLSAAELPALLSARQECQERSLYSSRQKLPLWRLGSFQQCQVGAGLGLGMVSLSIFSAPQLVVQLASDSQPGENST